MNSFEIPSDLRLAPQHTSRMRSIIEWVGKGWNFANHKSIDNDSNYRMGKKMVGLGVICTAALMTVSSCSGDSIPNLDVKPDASKDPHCIFSTDTDPSATTSYVIQPNDGRDSILFKIPGVNPNQCESSAAIVVAELNKDRAFDLDTPQRGDRIELPTSATFVNG